MTPRRLVLVLLTPPVALLAVLWAQHALDHHGGWYDPIDRQFDWHYPRCLP